MSDQVTERFERSLQLKNLDSLQIMRHLVQILSFVFLNGKILGLASTALIVPYLHPSQAPFSTVHGAFEALEFSLSKGVVPLLIIGVIGLTSITVGKVFCGWACPFGMVQDFLSYLPFQKHRVSPATAAQLKDIKWAFIGFSIISTIAMGFRSNFQNALGVFSDSPFSVLSPSGTLFAYIPWMLVWKSNILVTAGSVAWIKFGTLVAFIVPCLYVPRFFCRYACPMAGLLEPATPYKMLKISRGSKLTREDANRVLNDVCPMGVQLSSESEFVDHPNCIHCGKCVTEEKHLNQQFS